MQQAHARLEIEKSKVDTLLQRQLDLIACISLVTDVGKSEESKPAAAELLKSVQMQVWGCVDQCELLVFRIHAWRTRCAAVSSVRNADELDQSAIALRSSQISNTKTAERPSRQIEKLEFIGAGSYGKVYRATWRGLDVAVKNLILNLDMSGAERNKRMAIMEVCAVGVQR